MENATLKLSQEKDTLEIAAFNSKSQLKEIKLYFTQLENLVGDFFPLLENFNESLKELMKVDFIKNSTLRIIMENNVSSISKFPIIVKFKNENDINIANSIIAKALKANMSEYFIFPNSFERFFFTQNYNKLNSKFVNDKLEIFPENQEIANELIMKPDINKETQKIKEIGLFFDTGEEFQERKEVSTNLSIFPQFQLNFKDIENCSVSIKDCFLALKINQTEIRFSADIESRNCLYSPIFQKLFQIKCLEKNFDYQNRHRFSQKIIDYERLPKGEDVSAVIKAMKSPNFLKKLQELTAPKKSQPIPKPVEKEKKPKFTFIDSPPQNPLNSVYQFPPNKYQQYFKRKETKYIEVPTLVSEALVMVDKHNRPIDSKRVKPLDILNEELKKEAERKARQKEEENKPIEAPKPKNNTKDLLNAEKEKEIKRLQLAIEEKERNLKNLTHEIEMIEGNKTSKDDSDSNLKKNTTKNATHERNSTNKTQRFSRKRKSLITSRDSPIVITKEKKIIPEKKLEKSQEKTKDTQNNETENEGKSETQKTDLKKKENNDFETLKSFWVSTKLKPNTTMEISTNSQEVHQKLHDILSQVNQDEFCERKFI